VRLGELAERLGCRLEGDAALDVRGLSSLEGAGPQDLTFVTEARHLTRLPASRAAAVIAGEGWPGVDRPALRAANPLLAFARALALFHPAPPVVPGIHPSAVVAADARVAPTAGVGPLCVVCPGARVGPGSLLEAQVFVGAGVQIGADCRVHAQVALRDGTQVGDRVIIHSGAVLGADGFGYVRDGARHVKIPQVGRVVIEDDVEIGANTAIDRATLGETRVGRGTKIDNLVQIGHNVSVGPDAILVAQVGIAGSVRIGARAVLAGQVGVLDHVRIGEEAVVGAQSGVGKDVPDKGLVFGSPAVPHIQAKRQLGAVARLPLLRKAVTALEERLARLEARLRGGAEG
jgi:UDP-3-O-[3-hydroxymyristoyl] glucosamine N-acyltransferase